MITWIAVPQPQKKNKTDKYQQLKNWHSTGIRFCEL